MELITKRNELRNHVVILKTAISKLDYKEAGKRAELEFQLHDIEDQLSDVNDEVTDARRVEREEKRQANKAARELEAKNQINRQIKEAKEGLAVFKAIISDPELKVTVNELFQTLFAESVLPMIELLKGVTLPTTTVRISELEETLAKAMITAIHSDRELITPPRA